MLVIGDSPSTHSLLNRAGGTRTTPPTFAQKKISLHPRPPDGHFRRQRQPLHGGKQSWPLRQRRRLIAKCAPCWQVCRRNQSSHSRGLRNTYQPSAGGHPQRSRRRRAQCRHRQAGHAAPRNGDHLPRCPQRLHSYGSHVASGCCPSVGPGFAPDVPLKEVHLILELDRTLLARVQDFPAKADKIFERMFE